MSASIMVFYKSLKTNVCPTFYVNDTRIEHVWVGSIHWLCDTKWCVMMHLFVLTSSFEEYMQEKIWSEKSSRNLLKGLRFSFLEVIVLVFIAALFGICINRSLFGESKYMRHTNVLGFFIKAHLDTRDTVIFLTTLCQKTI